MHRILRTQSPLGALAALVVAAALLVGSATAQSIVFLVSPTPTVEALIEMIPDFEAETGIDVTVEAVAYDTMVENELLDLRTQQGRYDAFWVEAPFLGRLTSLDGLEPIGPIAEELGLDLSDFPEGLLENFTFDGNLYALPFEGALMVMAYRTDLLEAAGLDVPRTWEAYLSAAEQLHNPPDTYGTSIMGARHEALFYEYLNYLWGQGGQLFDASYQPMLDTPEALAGLEALMRARDVAPPGTLSYTWTESATAFQQGDVAMEMIFSDWTAALNDPDSSAVVGDWAYATVPGDEPSAFGGYGWGINAFSQNKEAAVEFIHWATSEDVQRRLFEVGSTPTRLSILTDPELNENAPYLQVFADAFARSQPPMKIAAYFDLQDSLSLRLSEALSDIRPAAEALQLAQEDWTEILRDGGYID